MRQSLAAALLRNGQTKEAEAVFRETIGKHPRDGRLLYGLWQTLVAQKRDVWDARPGAVRKAGEARRRAANEDRKR